MTNLAFRPVVGLSAITAITSAVMGAIAPSALAQNSDLVPITGGSADFRDAQIFVPDSGDIDPRAFVISPQGGALTIQNVQIDTPLGRIPSSGNSLIFQRVLSPVLDTPPGGVPSVGDTGRVAGTVTFASFTSSGAPIFFNNVPAELSFTIDSITQTAPPQLSTQFQTPPNFIVTTTGEVITDQTRTATGSVFTDVFIFQVVEQPSGPNDVFNTLGFIPAEAFTTEIDGASYFADFDTSLTGEFVTIPLETGASAATGFGPDGTPNTDIVFEPSTNFISEFRVVEPPEGSQTTLVAVGPASRVFPGLVGVIEVTSDDSDDADEEGSEDSGDEDGDEVGSTQDNPILPVVVVIGVFFFENVPSGNWFDPPLTSAYEYEMVSDSTFTEISGFPEGVDADDQFVVSVGDQVLGEFGAGETLVFSDYSDILGDALVDGGVSAFTVSAIEPGVDVEDPTAFPLKLEFSTPTASFEMRAPDAAESSEEELSHVEADVQL